MRRIGTCMPSCSTYTFSDAGKPSIFGSSPRTSSTIGNLLIRSSLRRHYPGQVLGVARRPCLSASKIEAPPLCVRVLRDPTSGGRGRRDRPVTIGARDGGAQL